LPLPTANLFANAYSDAFIVMVVAAIIGVGLSLTLRRSPAVAGERPAPSQSVALEMAG